MTYILSFVVIAIAVVLANARDVEVNRGKHEPTARPTTGAVAPGTANERVGQG